MKTPQPRYVVVGDWWRCPLGKFHRVTGTFRSRTWLKTANKETIKASCGADFPAVYGRDVRHAEDAEPSDGPICRECARIPGSPPPAHLEVAA